MRYTYLDALRGLAALAVVFFHYRGFSPGALPAEDWLWPAYRFGGHAVQLFWLLSGIVFMATYGTSPVGGREFFVRRFARLYPLHLATLLAMLALDLVSRRVNGAPLLPANDALHFALHIFMASNWLSEHPHSFNVPVWSVSMEVLAYTAFFIAMRGRCLTLGRCSSIALVSCFVAVFTGLYTATCVGLFFVGTVLQQLPERTRFLHLAALPVLTVTITLACAIGSSPWSRHLGLVINYAVFPALLLCVLALDVRMRPVPRALRWLGESTYGVYLLHLPVLTVMLLSLGAPRASELAAHGWFLASFVLVVLALSVAAYRHFERPAQSAILARFSAASQSSSRAAADLPSVPVA